MPNIKTITKDQSRTGSETILPLNFHDKINIRACLKSFGLTWRSFPDTYGYKHKTGLSFAIPGIISGDITY